MRAALATRVGVLCCMMLVAVAAPSGDVLDRIVATVNGHIILQSDWDEEVAYEALGNSRGLSVLTPEQRKAALDHLIDQELIREEVHTSDFRAATAAEVEQRIAEIRKLYADAADSNSWQQRLRSFGLDENELRNLVQKDLNLLQAINQRLRPGIEINAQNVEQYYQENLLPQLRQSGAKIVPLADVAPQIRELLAQQRVNDLLVNWIRTLRSNSKIEVPDPTPQSHGAAH
ncbi:MAG TPA: SurA N-terminal domain-containing protein [Terriglobales bacterium]|nr:SurA N-terminal domain-containing protein [Terriglobales bacterium]